MTFEEQFAKKNLNESTTHFMQVSTFASPWEDSDPNLDEIPLRGEDCDTPVSLRVTSQY
jgi:hypothetical protein